MLKMLRRIILACAVGLVLSVWIIQNTPAVQERVGTMLLRAIEKAWSARVSVASYRVNFFTFSICFTKGTVRPADAKQYAWRFDQCKVHISPWQLFWNSRITLDLTFNHVKAQTRYVNGKTDLMDHIADIFATRAGAGFSVVPHSITLNNFHLDVFNNKQIISAHLPCRFYIAKEQLRSDQQPQWYGNLQLINGVIKYNGSIITDHFAGRATFNKSPLTGNWTGALSSTLKSPWLDTDAVYVAECCWEPTGKTVVLRDQSTTTTNNTLSLSALITPNWSYGLKGSVPLALLGNAVMRKQGTVDANTSYLRSLQGACAVNVTVMPKPDDVAISGSLILSDVGVAGFKIPKIICSLRPGGAGVTTSHLDVTPAADMHVTGTLDWFNRQGQAKLHLTNAMPITSWSGGSLPWAPLILNPHDLSVTMTLNTNGSVWGTYRCAVASQTAENKYTYTGALLFRNRMLGMQGQTRYGQYDIMVGMSPHPHLASWHYKVRDRWLVDLKTTPTNPLLLQGTVEWTLLRSFLDVSTRRLIFDNKSSFAVSLDQQSLETIKGSVRLRKGRFYLPEYYNMITDIRTDVVLQPAAKKVMLDNVVIGLSKGTISSPRATLALTESYGLGLMHMPLQLNDVFVNWHGDFYGFVYGNLLLNKIYERPAQLSGTVVLKKSMLREGLLLGATSSLGTMESVNTMPLGIDIRLLTEKPIKAQTETINTLATVDLVIRRNPLKDFGATPTISGNINLGNGSLKLLQKKLHIAYGNIQFVANQLNDPIIDLVAKNRIGKYQISLQATGSLQKPTLLLESNPELSEEQIIGLLMTGSEQATLQADLMSMLMQNLDTLLVGNKKERKTAFFDKITKTFKYIQITPTYSDEVGKVGWQGALSVNLSDQLHAQIQKNLSLENDFSAKLEYLLSDDVNLRAIRDHRGDWGSEVEVRLKL